MTELLYTASPYEVVYTIIGLGTLLALFILLMLALRDQNRIAVLPADHPDRMIAADAVWNEILRIMLAVGVPMIGFAAMLTPPLAQSTALNPSVLSVTLFVVLVFWPVMLLAWAVKDLAFRQRLFKRMASVRLICADSTYTECPYVAKRPTTDEASKWDSLIEPPELPPNH